MNPVVSEGVAAGTVLRGVPRALLGFSRLSVWWWGSEAEGAALPAAAALTAANSALRRAPVLLQAAAVRAPPALAHLAFPPAHERDDGERALILPRPILQLKHYSFSSVVIN